MYLLGVILVLITSQYAFCDDNKVVNPTRTAKESEFPYVALIREYFAKFGDSMNVCGGILVSAKHVMTAAHCVAVHSLIYKERKVVAPDDLEIYTVIVGTINANGTGDGAQSRKIERIRFPKDIKLNMKTGQLQDDLALLFMKTDFSLSVYVIPAKIKGMDQENVKESFSKYTQAEHSHKCVVPGWGNQNTSKITFTNKLVSFDPATQLRVAPVKPVKFKKCQKLLCSVRRDHCFVFDFAWETFICAIGNEVDVCEGDSGSPLICEGHVIAMLSFIEDEWGCGKGVPSGYVSGVAINNFIINVFYPNAKSNSSKINILISLITLNIIHLCI